MDPDPSLSLYILIFLILLSGFFSGAQIALFSLSQITVRSLVESKRKHAEIVARLKSQPQKLLLGLLFIHTLVNVSAAVLAAGIAGQRFGFFGPAIVVGVMTFLILFFVEIIPKSFGQQHAERIALNVAPVLQAVFFICSPIIVVMDMITTSIQKMFHIKDSAFRVSEEDVRAMVSIGHEEGTVERDEKEMIERVFLLNDITTEDVMTPEEYIVSFTNDMTIREVIPIMHQSGFSRFPTYDDDGDITGIVYLKDVFVLLSQEYRLGKNSSLEEVMATRVSDIAKEPVFIPETMHIDDLLKDFQRRHVHIAIVVDEHGTVRGLVTLEDLIEEIVGEIVDETDLDDELIERIDANTIIVDPRVTIGRVNIFFNAKFKAARQKTIGWLVLKHFARIPEKGDAVIINDYNCIIEEAEDRRIKRIKIVKTAKAKL